MHSRFIFSLLLVILCSGALICQETNDHEESKEVGHRHWAFGIEGQVYPTGIIPGIRIERFLGTKSSINLRLGYQIINHRDLGVQDNEEGSGYGFSLAYRYFFKEHYQGFSMALRADYWKNKIDWTNPPPVPINDQLSGTSNVDVIQPTLMAEYAFGFGKIQLIPSVSFGFEWNVATSGKPTGEGAILLVGTSLLF